jgi:hypothetical protein
MRVIKAPRADVFPWWPGQRVGEQSEPVQGAARRCRVAEARQLLGQEREGGVPDLLGPALND